MNKNLQAYLLGFFLSLVLTLGAYLLVEKELLTGTTLLLSIVFIGVIQALVQLVLFLHLGREEKPRWNLGMFLFMVLVTSIVVLGSLWIMHNLNVRTM